MQRQYGLWATKVMAFLALACVFGLEVKRAVSLYGEGLYWLLPTTVFLPAVCSYYLLCYPRGCSSGSWATFFSNGGFKEAAEKTLALTLIALLALWFQEP